MTIPQEQENAEVAEGINEWWSADIDVSRTPSPGMPAKRMRMTLQDIAQDIRENTVTRDSDLGNLLRLERGPELLGYGSEVSTFKEMFSASNDSFQDVMHDVPAAEFGLQELKPLEFSGSRRKMQTGCIPCLVNGIPCDPKNPGCRLAMSDDWSLNYEQDQGTNGDLAPESMSLTIIRPDTGWRRSWRERHSLNFFVNFSAPQMAGFFDSTFWQRMVIQTSYHEPAILHAITAIGALHECIMQRAFADEKRKARAIEFALSQCNKAISCLTSRQASNTGIDFARRGRKTPNSRLALTTCVLFTCFEAMQGRCDSAVNHALQGRRLLQATGRPNVTSMSPSEEDDLEQMRPIVERLEVQATALLDKGRRPEVDTSDQTPPLPPIEHVFSLDHAHSTLHTALNSVMRFMQGFHPTAPRDHIAVTMAEKYLRYAPWFAKWEAAFTTYLANRREYMPNMDLKRAMVLKANHLVGTMLASVDQSAGPVAYDAYEAEFRAIVDLSREVLASFSCPPLPTLTGGSSGTPYLSFSLWVTDPLWMAISRCRNPSIRQAAFTLLSQNPRQEGIWHAGPQLSNHKYMRRGEQMQNATNGAKDSAKEEPPSDSNKRKYGSEKTDASVNGSQTNGAISEHEDAPGEAESTSGTETSGTMTEWANLSSRITEYSEHENETDRDIPDVPRYESHCTGRCSIPRFEDLQALNGMEGE